MEGPLLRTGRSQQEVSPPLAALPESSRPAMLQPVMEPLVGLQLAPQAQAAAPQMASASREGLKARDPGARPAVWPAGFHAARSTCLWAPAAALHRVRVLPALTLRESRPLLQFLKPGGRPLPGCRPERRSEEHT